MTDDELRDTALPEEDLEGLGTLEEKDEDDLDGDADELDGFRVEGENEEESGL